MYIPNVHLVNYVQFCVSQMSSESSFTFKSNCLLISLIVLNGNGAFNNLFFNLLQIIE